MKILVIGAGAIGSFIGGVLQNSGNDVVFLDMPAMTEKLSQNGINITGLNKEIYIKNPKLINSVTPGESFDLAVISVKSFDTKNAVQNLPKDFAKCILTFQNGLGNEEILASIFGDFKIISGTITYPVSYLKPGHVHIENTKAGLGLAPFCKGQDINFAVKLFKDAGLNVIFNESYQSLKWSKLILNITCNATCAILDMLPGEIFENNELINIEKQQLLEIFAVTDKMKIKIIDLPGYPVKILVLLYKILPPFMLKVLLGSKIKNARGNKKPSLMIALEKGDKKSEVRYLNGAVNVLIHRVKIIYKHFITPLKLNV